MLPLLTANQIREGDAYTIANEPIASINLMERASKAFVGWFVNHFPDKKISIGVYCGTGNNGGDGLAIARMLHTHGYDSIDVVIARFSDKTTEDFNTNLGRLKDIGLNYSEIEKGGDPPADKSDLIIDALLGSGLNKPLEGDYKRLVNFINELNSIVVSVDTPTGFYTDGEINLNAIAIKADLVITFQQPKLNFLLPESKPFIDCWEAVNIGISDKYLQSVDTAYQAIEIADIRKLIKPRRHFSNKGTYGHTLIIAGQEETMGAALISASACAYAGAGLTTACIPKSGLTALNTYMPELMAIVRNGADAPEIKWDKFNAIGVGPGLGKERESLELLKNVLKNYNKPVVIDADALNLLAENKELLKQVPEKSIITPHMKEFDRLFGEHTSWWQRMQTGIQRAQELKLYIVLKNDYTLTITPQGKVFFNTTGNPAMATGGMGDTLTGIIASFLAQHYSPEEACIMGVFIHGKAGDELALTNRMNVVMPAQLAQHLPITIAKLMA